MVKNFLFLLIFFFLSLIEQSFLVHFSFANFTPHLIFIAIFLLIFFDLKEDWALPALFGGFFLDVFSGGIFGIKTLNLVFVTLFLRFIWSFIRKKSFFWFIFIFLLALLLYNFSFFLFKICFKRSLISFNLEPISLIYNLIFAILGFLFYEIFLSLKKRF